MNRSPEQKHFQREMERETETETDRDLGERREVRRGGTREGKILQRNQFQTK